ncbi:MAG: hypothetical protein MJ170_00240 [Alphaproteobacteria bacterium]|nr:hypothetical protein [Alphaproteobacteria bacterium]
MENIIIIGGLSFIILAMIGIFILISQNNRRIQNINKTLEFQYNLIVKVQSILKTKSATNAFAENAEIIYQDLLNSLIPIMAELNVMPRQTNEHALWRSLGGIIDEYAKNPFVLEKLRRAIKLNPEIAHCVDNYMTRSDKLLTYLTATDPNGILTTTFTDGLLGQSLTFFAQAKQLATQE